MQQPWKKPIVKPIFKYEEVTVTSEEPEKKPIFKTKLKDLSYNNLISETTKIDFTTEMH